MAMECNDRGLKQLKLSKQVHVLHDAHVALCLGQSFSKKCPNLELLHRVCQQLEPKSTTEKTFPLLEEASQSDRLDCPRHVAISCDPFLRKIAAIAQSIKDSELELSQIISVNCPHEDSLLTKLGDLGTPRPDDAAEQGLGTLLSKYRVELSFLLSD